MSKAKWFKFYHSDFLTGIYRMSSTEVAVYIITICELYDHEGSCPRDDARMADRCQMRQYEFTKAMDRLIAKGKLDFYAGQLTNKRVSEEIQNRVEVAIKKATTRAHSQPAMKHGASTEQARTKHARREKVNGFNGNVGLVQPYIEIREDKKESTLEVSTLQEEALEEKRKRSAAAVEAFLKREAARTHGTKMRGKVG